VGDSTLINLAQEEDKIRQNLLKDMSTLTKRPVISYVSQFGHPAGNIIPDDVNLFHEFLEILDHPKKLDLILHSPGGVPEGTEKIVKMLRSEVKSFRVIIPESAKSAATLLALSANEILMSCMSELGPIDPQIRTSIDPLTGQPIYRPAWSILNTLEHLEKEVKEKGRDPGLIITIVRNLDPTMLDVASKAIDYSITLAEDWLHRYMGLTKEKAKATATYLSDAGIHLTHGRVISLEEAKKQGLRVSNIEDDKKLWPLVREYYLRTKKALRVPRVKLADCEKTTLIQEVPIVKT
jgi:hypothetical protein